MNTMEAHAVATRIRAAWPDAYMDDERVAYWAEFLMQFTVEDATRALSILQRKQAKIPSQGTFTDVVEGEQAQKHKCPHCGIGYKTEARVQEHIDNVHYDLVA